MGFLGYMLKVNGNVLPNGYIDLLNYKCTPHKRRVIDSWYDGDGIYHETYSSHTSTLIQFATNGLLMPDKEAFISYFKKKADLKIEYWNDETGIYETGTFRRNDFTFMPYRIRKQDIIYKALDVELKED